MNKKTILIVAILIILIVILGLWISGIIPKHKMDNKYFPIIPEQKTSELEDSYRLEYEGIEDINDFYNYSITSKYQDLRTLPENYSKEQAQKDNCFIIGAMVHNDNLYSEFMENYKNKKTAFIRVAQNTVEGDLILTDILYYEKSDKVYIVTDNTRDKFSAETDRIIELKEYNYISEYKNNNHLYWVLYNEDITEENFKTDNVFVITTIN